MDHDLEVHLILVVDEAVVKNTQVLMDPQTNHTVLVLAIPGLDEQDALENLGDVAEVEGVVGLCGSG